MGYYLDLLLDRPLAQRVALIAGLVLTLAAADYALVHRRQTAQIAHIIDDLDRSRLQEARARSELRRLPQLRQEAAALQRELRSRLPRGTGPPTPLEAVSARAAAAGLDVVRFQPGAVRAGEHYTETVVEVDLVGRFHDLLRFFESSGDPRDPLTAANLAIESLPSEDARTVLRVTLEMAALRMPGPEPDTAMGENAVSELDTDPEGGAVPEAETPRSPASPAGRSLEMSDAFGTATSPLLGKAAARLPPRDPFQPYRPPSPPEPEPEPEAAGDQPHEPLPAPRFHAVGIVWGTQSAVALVKDADGFRHLVQPGALLDGHPYRVKAITPCEVIMETAGDDPTPRETRLKLARCGAYQGSE